MIDIFGPGYSEDSNVIKNGYHGSFFSTTVVGYASRVIGKSDATRPVQESGDVLRYNEQEVLNEIYNAIGSEQVI